MIQMSFTKAVIEFFGKKPNQSTGDFMAEIKALTAQDRAYFAKLFASEKGVEIVGGLGQ